MKPQHKSPQPGDQKMLYCAQARKDFLHHYVGLNQDDYRVYGWRCQGCQRLVEVSRVRRRY